MCIVCLSYIVRIRRRPNKACVLGLAAAFRVCIHILESRHSVSEEQHKHDEEVRQSDSQATDYLPYMLCMYMSVLRSLVNNWCCCWIRRMRQIATQCCLFGQRFVSASAWICRLGSYRRSVIQGSLPFLYIPDLQFTHIHSYVLWWSASNRSTGQTE